MRDLFAGADPLGAEIMVDLVINQALRQVAADDVVMCPECGAILVRTDESGL